MPNSLARPEQTQSLETSRRMATIGVYAREAVRQAKRGADDSTAIYANGCKLGAGLAVIAVRRILEEGGHHSLNFTSHQISGWEYLGQETSDEVARRALMVGFMSELEKIILTAAKGGLQFSIHDDGAIFGNAVRDGKREMALWQAQRVEVEETAEDEQ